MHNRSRQICFAIILPYAYAAILITSIISQASAIESDDPSVTASFLIPAEHDGVTNPNAVASTDDGGSIVAGTAAWAGYTSVWAAKIDNKGGLLWRYYADLEETAKAAFDDFSSLNGLDKNKPAKNGFIGGLGNNLEFADFATRARIAALAASPGGAVFFCGDMPGPSNAYSPGLLIHLDADGHLLRQQLIFPGQQAEHGIARFSDCIPERDGVMLLGTIVEFHSGDNQYFYWLVDCDANGNKRWEQRIPMAAGIFADEVGPLVQLTDGDMVFSAAHAPKSEVVRVNAHGEVQARKSLDGDFRLVRNALMSENVDIIGFFGSNQFSMLARVTLNSKLAELARQQRQVDYYPSFAYRLNDGSLALFGLQKPVFRAPRSVIVHLDASLQHEHILEPPRNRPPFLDGGQIYAAPAISAPDRFVTARGLGYERTVQPTDAIKRGAEIDVVRF